MKQTLFLLTLLISNFATAQIPENGLIAYWPLNGNAPDESGNAQHGTATGNITAAEDRFGNAGCAIYSGGEQGSRIDIPNSALLNTQFSESNPYTVSAWFTVDNTYSIGSLLYFPCFNDLSFAQSPRIYFTASCSPVFDPYTWYHIAVTKGDQGLHVYVNGQEVCGPLSVLPCTGTSNGYIAEMINGKIDEIRVYNRTLSATEITGIYDHSPTCLVTANKPAHEENGKKVVRAVNLIGQEIRDLDSYSGPAVIFYSDGSVRKVMKL